MEFVAEILIAAFAGGVAGYFGGRAKALPVPFVPTKATVPAVVLPDTTNEGKPGIEFEGHAHDWHIRGKYNGVVTDYCVVVGCPETREHALG
jgi:hypothetical protein